MPQTAFQNNSFLLYSDSLWDASNPLKNSGSIPADNAALSAINGLAKRGNNYTQATGSAQPTYKTAIVNSNNVIRFDGNDQMTCANATNNAYTGAMTLIAAIYPTTVTGTHRLFTKSSGAGNGFAFGTVSTQIILTAKGRTDYQTATGVVDINAWQVIAAIYNGTDSVSFYKNRSFVSTQSGGLSMNSSTGSLILGANSGSAEFFQGDCQILFWGWRVVNSGELTILLDAACKRIGL